MEKYKRLAVLKNEIEVRLLESVLDENKIPFVIKSYHDSVYNGIFQSQKGWGYIEVPEEYMEQAKTIYDDISKAEISSDIN